MKDGPHTIHDLVVELDYSVFLIRGGEADYRRDDEALLSEAHTIGEGAASDGSTVLVRSPRQFDSAMAVRVEIWDHDPADDLAGWQEAFVSALEVSQEGRLTFDSPTTTPVECAVPPGRYQILITGRGFSPPGSPEPARPGGSWRVRLWPAAGDSVTRRLRSVDTSWLPSTAPAVSIVRWTNHPGWTMRLRTELLARTPAETCCRRAEATVLLRLTRDAPDLRAQVTGQLEALLGTRTADPDLPAELGLTNPSGVPVHGLPPTMLIKSRSCCGAAAWCGALGVAGELIVRRGRMQALVRYPAYEPMMALLMLGRRISIPHPELSEIGLFVQNATTLLKIVGADQTLEAWRAANR